MSDSLGELFEHCPGLLFTADSDGTLTRVSKSLRERLGAPLAEDATVASLVQPDDREAIEASLAKLAEGEASVVCDLSIPDPGGELVPMCCELRRGSDGTLHGMLELDTAKIRVERRLLRSIMDTLEIVAWAVDPDGTFVFHDGKALATAGLERGQFLGANIFELYPEKLLDPIREALAGTPSDYESEAHGVHWHTWNVPLKNQAGETDHCVGLTLDISESIRIQRELQEQLDTIQEQKRAIEELSSPVIEVWDRVLTVPLVGVVQDGDRMLTLTERLLDKVARTGARFVVLDLTGIEDIDTSTANSILRLVRSLDLLGSEGLLTGISPHVAQTMVGLGIELGDVATRRTLRDGLRYCMSALRG